MRLALALVLALAPLGVASAQGQGGCQSPILAMPQPPASFAPGQSFTLSFAIENVNEAPIKAVRAQVTSVAPAGWSVAASQTEVTLGPKNFTTDALAITAPSRGGGEERGNITLHVTFVCTTGDTLTTSSADATVPVSLEPLTAPSTIVYGALAAVAVLVAILGSRRLRRGVGIVPARLERDVEPGKSVKYVFRVENRRSRPQRLALLGVGVPEGWSLHLALDDVELEPGEEKSLWAVLRCAADAPAGSEATMTLRLESPRGPREGATATLVAKVVPSP
ncbi:MAG: hypothetical protein QOE90_2666 [Thermoplasmata archaeon]|jgi:uncharacterized membrane protein|nr:hypothetical protein [Thermoplasmata archaeon]